MARYYGLDYAARTRTSGTIDRSAVEKTFADDHPERNALIQALVDRVNLLLAELASVKAREAHDISYTDANGIRRNIGDMLDSLALAEANTIILVDPEDNQLIDPDGNLLVA